MRSLISLISAVVLAAPAFAQSSDAYQGRVMRLAEILGGLHAIRTLCDPGGDTKWRDRMMELMRLERPSTDERNNLTNRFNSGYAEAQSRFSSCSAEARAYSATLAREGESLSRSLSQSVS